MRCFDGCRFFLALALLAVLQPAIPSADAQATFLDQGWDDGEREEFYFTPQGSQLIPFRWFLELERHDSDVPFRDPDHIRGYGFLSADESPRNPDALPIGFVRDGVDPVASEIAGLGTNQQAVIRAATRFAVKKGYLGDSFDQKLYPREQEAWFGLTCAACHTHEIEYYGTTLRIDGGSSQADIESFLRDLGLALDATAKDRSKLQRFAHKLGRGEVNLRDFRQEVQQIADAVNRLVERNKADHPYGYARLDAFGAILNAVCETALNQRDNRRPSNAPVSYPSLWNTPQMGYVQWNASAANAEARNAGEVLGVFGTYTLDPGDKQFDSTIRLRNMIRLEHGLISRLKAPDWPEEVLGKLDVEKVRLGKQLFMKNCLSCHAVRDAEGRFALNGAGRIPIRSSTLEEIGTDGQFLQNLRPTDLILTAGLKPLLGDRERVPRAAMLGVVVQRILANRAAAEDVDLSEHRTGPQDPPHPAGIGSGYIARPLEGIWTSAPYFHNGSGANLYETLLPADQRSKSFWVGNRAFDPIKVGFVTTESAMGSEFRVVDQAGNAIPGNSNAGHEGHGANESEGFTQTFENGTWRDFTEGERYALVEYMKSLSSKPEVVLEAIPDGEADQIDQIVELTAERMRRQYGGDARMLRGVHPKDHGCVTAKFEVRDDLPAEYAVGVFQPGMTYDAWIRFSNADIEVNPDSSIDPNGSPKHGSRGMAIKLLGVQGEPLLPPHGALTQDFVMVNQPAFAFANVEDYELLSRVLLEHFGQPGAAAHFFTRRFATGTPAQQARAQRTAQIVQRIAAANVDGDSGAFFPPPASAADNPYFSAAPFLFGEGRVMKFRAAPVERSADPPDADDPNYLRNALIKRLKNGPIVFEFAVQVRDASQLDIESDIENASTEWDDDFVTVAKITIPPQEFDSPQRREKCERLFFTPWHGITDHRPLGGINRLRKQVYIVSGHHRNLPKEPVSLDD